MYLVEEHPEIAQECYKVSRTKGTEYFFACSCINITFTLLKRLETMSMVEIFSTEVGPEQTLANFNLLFAAVVQDFDRYFRNHARAYDLMSFSYIMVDSLR